MPKEERTNVSNYTFPWGFHLGELVNSKERIPLYTPSDDGGFCLFYDKVSEKKVDTLLETLCLELLGTMPFSSLTVDLFDFGKKKFYSLSPLQYLEAYRVSYTQEMINQRFMELEKIIVSRHTELLCCNRQTINEHNQKSRMKQGYHLVLVNLENFPNEKVTLLRVQNFIESAVSAGFYVIPFGYEEMLKDENPSLQAIIKHFKNIVVKNGEFGLNKEVFEFQELLSSHKFEPLALDKTLLLEKVMQNADLESFTNPENIKLESNTKVTR